jgi:hypothetical protein
MWCRASAVSYEPGVACGGLDVAGGHNAPFCGVSGLVRDGDLRVKAGAELGLQSGPQVGQGGALAVL